MPKHDIHIKNKSLFISQISQLLAEKHSVTITLYGNSMLPYLEDGRDKAVLESVTQIKLNDIILAKTGNDSYAMHRVVEIDGDCIKMRGDGNINVEVVHKSDAIAQVAGFYRKGKTSFEPVTCLKWKIYSFLWTRLLKIRRPLLFLYKTYRGSTSKQEIRHHK